MNQADRDKLKDVRAPSRAPPLPPPDCQPKAGLARKARGGAPELTNESLPEPPPLSRDDSGASSAPPSPIPSPPPSPIPSPPSTPTSPWPNAPTSPWPNAPTSPWPNAPKPMAKSAMVLPPPPSQPPPSRPDSPHRQSPVQKPASLSETTATASSTVSAGIDGDAKSSELAKAVRRPPNKAPPSKLSLAGMSAFKAVNRGGSGPGTLADAGTPAETRTPANVEGNVAVPAKASANAETLADVATQAKEETLVDVATQANAESLTPTSTERRVRPAAVPKSGLKKSSSSPNIDTKFLPGASSPTSQSFPSRLSFSNRSPSLTTIAVSPPSSSSSSSSSSGSSTPRNSTSNNSSSSLDASSPKDETLARSLDAVVKSRSKIGLAAFMGLQARYSRKSSAKTVTPIEVGPERKSAEEPMELPLQPNPSTPTAFHQSVVESAPVAPTPLAPLAASAPLVAPKASESSDTEQKNNRVNDCSSGRQLLSDATLIAGWVAVQVAGLDHVYYFHPNSQSVTWTRPSASTPPPDSRPNLEHLARGWVALWSANARNYYFYNPATEDTSWDLPTEEDEHPPPPEGPPPPLEEPPSSLAAELRFINDVLRPKYGDGKLLTEPGLVESLFVYMVNNASQRHVIFCEFFLSCFRNEIMLQQLLKNGWWKRCLLVLISEANDTSNEALDYISMSHNEVLDYVLLTLVELFAYFFRHFEEPHGAVFVSHQKPLPLGLPGKVTMYSFLMDAVNEFVRQRMNGITLKIMFALINRLCDWTLRPRWVTDFSCPEWPNLFSCLEAQEEILFFHQKDFVLPSEGEFAGLALLEAIVVLLERVKAPFLETVPEVDPAVIKLQKMWAVRGIQEYEFFSRARDFFRYIGDMDSCMEKVGSKGAGIVFRAQAPPHCSQAEFCHLLLSRKRLNYGPSSSVQKKIASFVNRCVEHYKKVFIGEAQLAPRPEVRAPRSVPLLASQPGSKTGLSNFLKKHTTERQAINGNDALRRNSSKYADGSSPPTMSRKMSLDVLARKMSLVQISVTTSVNDRDDKKSHRSDSRIFVDTQRASLTEQGVPGSPKETLPKPENSPKPETPPTSPGKKGLFKRRF